MKLIMPYFDSSIKQKTRKVMKTVSKEDFFNFFKDRTNISTQAESTKVWTVTKRGSSIIIAKSVEDNDGNEEYFISE